LLTSPIRRLEVKRFTLGASVVICGLVAAATLSSCSAGQQAQTAGMEPAVNGSAATINAIGLRDIRIRAVQTSDALRPGKPVELVFVATNQSPDAPDQLVGITTDVGQLSLSGNTTVPPSGVLIVGTLDRPAAVPLQSVQASNTAKATVTLTQPISNGLTYDFTFKFARAGETTVAVPITAGAEAPRQQPAAQG
jgi:copper(I)-binding protein